MATKKVHDTARVFYKDEDNADKNRKNNQIHKEGWMAGYKQGLKTKKTLIGLMRQWLNEDRITDPKKMVTNEDLETWL